MKREDFALRLFQTAVGIGLIILVAKGWSWNPRLFSVPAHMYWSNAMLLFAGLMGWGLFGWLLPTMFWELFVVNTGEYPKEWEK